MFRPRPLAAIAAALAALAVSAAPASADLLGPSDCDTPDSSAVFAPWLDSTNYFLAPDGGFENGADGWTLSGASVVGGNESYNLSGAGASSLKLNPGDVATSPAVCVGLEHPTFRFVARKAFGLTSSVAVAVQLENGTSVPVGVVPASSSWQPTAVQLVVANLLPTLTGGDSTRIRFQFAGVTGSTQVDDVYVDPKYNH